MYYLINTMGANAKTPGMVVSKHKTEEAAKKANEKFQKRIVEKNGPNSYIPTIIIQSPKKQKTGDWAERV